MAERELKDAGAATNAVMIGARLRLRGNAATVIPAPLHALMADVAAASPFVDEDRALEHELRAMTARIASGDFIARNHGDRA